MSSQKALSLALEIKRNSIDSGPISKANGTQYARAQTRETSSSIVMDQMSSWSSF